MKKTTSITLGVIIFVLIIVGVTLLEGLKNREATNTTESHPTPTRTSIDYDNPVKYDGLSTNQLLQILESRPTPANESDNQIRSRLIQSLGEESGTIHSTNEFSLEYVKEPNTFEIEIKSRSTNEAKNEALSFLRNAGLTDDGICKLPLIFYLSPEMLRQTTEANFRPIPDFCLQ